MHDSMLMLMDDPLFMILYTGFPAVTIGLAIGLPLYLGWFLYRTRLAKRHHKSSPSSILLNLYLISLIIMFMFSFMVIPNFYKIEPRSKQSEAKTNLGAIFTAQVSYFDEHNTYAASLEDLKWKPEGRTKYAYFCGDELIPNTKGDPIPRSARPSVVGSSPTGFTCAAVGNVDHDPDLDYWFINDAKIIVNEPSDL